MQGSIDDRRGSTTQHTYALSLTGSCALETFKGSVVAHARIRRRQCCRLLCYRPDHISTPTHSPTWYMHPAPATSGSCGNLSTPHYTLRRVGGGVFASRPHAGVDARRACSVQITQLRRASRSTYGSLVLLVQYIGFPRARRSTCVFRLLVQDFRQGSVAPTFLLLSILSILRLKLSFRCLRNT